MSHQKFINILLGPQKQNKFEHRPGPWKVSLSDVKIDTILTPVLQRSRHREIIVKLGYDSGHIANPFLSLFYPLRSEYPAPFHQM